MGRARRHRSDTRLLPRVLGWSHAIITAVVVVGTGNHWLLDVAVGWVLVVLVWTIAEAQRSSTGRFRGCATAAADDTRDTATEAR